MKNIFEFFFDNLFFRLKFKFVWKWLSIRTISSKEWINGRDELLVIFKFQNVIQLKLSNILNFSVVTGASVGIGLALCQDLVQAGVIVCGMSKRKDKMEVMKPIKNKSWNPLPPRHFSEFPLLISNWEENLFSSNFCNIFFLVQGHPHHIVFRGRTTAS